MKAQLPDFTHAKVLVVGDVMLDRYWHGVATRISPEAPVPVVRIDQRDERPGGAGNVALNVAALGAYAHIVGVTGDDKVANTLETQLQAAKVNTTFHRVAGASTVSKLRVLSAHQQLIRCDFEDSFEDANPEQLINDANECLAACNIMVLSDYAKGTLQRSVALIQAASARNIPVFVDPKTPDFSLYAGAALITPNLKEFEAAVGPCPDEATLVRKGEALMNAHGIAALLITRGAQGMSLLQKGQNEIHLPARSHEVFDVTGAGDTVIATMAACVASGLTLQAAMVIANLAASVVVTKLGAATVSVPELQLALLDKRPAEAGCLSEDQLMLVVNDAKKRGERIVMTNGCFDILHAGHVTYLQQAKALGDRLIVAVNTDASVKQLKGEGRPINACEQRMLVLASLGVVDWVVSFSEETPERVITRVLPDTLVKGGDYKPEDVAGGKAVIEKGGEVIILGFVEGLSTSNIIKKLKKE